jgi:enoyl-CoA hydratase/carnithine racemase
MTEEAGLADALEPGSIERIAAEWLAAERDVANGGAGNPERAEELARELSDRYDRIVREATREELRLAWEAARALQGEQVMGSEAWANARRIAELMRDEYQAADPESARG